MGTSFISTREIHNNKLKLAQSGHQAHLLSPLSANTTSQLDILGHNRHTLSVNGAQVGVFEETNKVGLRRFLEGEDGGGLETEIGLKILGDFADKTLERGLYI